MIPLSSMSSSARRATSWLSASADGTARLWNASTGDQISVLKADGYLQKALFSPDGQFVLTAVNDNTARIWKTDGSEFTSLVGHENQVAAAAFSSDGRLVATGSLDGTAKIWSLADGRVIATLKRPHRAADGCRLQPGRSVDRHDFAGSNRTNMAGQGWG